ncbi:hypothetical protein [Pseudorhodoferax sp. Leaf265]|uniref:hypothetical protein n=1 Tax=Pseudorhodoferax sp. Leaf265 TaxID=1736315 RepID=UPI0006FFBFEF|nr:hypothetical protein [Pseudorhodoferax sp. Leaf265]KQP02771.1 hypothetical protein ASF45_16015 [Pseudorhodoferax sp. Leaf265]
MSVNGIFKVIPSGVIDHRRLRATVMLSPSPGKQVLSTLPSTLVDEWRKKNWTLRVVRLRVTGDDCPATFEDAIRSPQMSADCKAHWSSGAVAWSASPPKWLQTLWEDGFKDNEGQLPADVWGILERSLLASNAGHVLQAGKTLDPKSPDPKEGSTNVEAVVPSRQSDLALLLESERAHEICSTARWAHGDFITYSEEENACLGKIFCASRTEADTPPQNPENKFLSPEEVNRSPEQQKLRDAARSRFIQAQEAVDKQYEKCGNAKPGLASAPWLLSPADHAGDRGKVSEALPHAARSHQAANPHEPRAAVNSGSDVVMQRYFAIQGSAALSRLFGLTVDLDINRDDLNRALSLSSDQSGSEDTVVHLLLGIVPEGAETDKVIWTLVRYRPGREMHFFPASRLELLTSAKRGVLHPQASQHEGVLALGQQFTGAPREPNAQPPILSRFALSSLDVQRATNGALDRMVLPDPKEIPPAAGAPEPLLACKPSQWARKTHSTAGLVLLDRGRLEQTVNQFAARTSHLKQPQLVVLDSTDLLVGYRLDIGVPSEDLASGECGVAWRSLMARQVTYGNHDTVSVRNTMQLLMGGAIDTPSGWQQTLDDAQLSLPARLAPTAESGKDEKSKDAYVEEVVAVWTGEPMAAQCAGTDAQKRAPAPVGIGETIRLPTKDHAQRDRLPPPLRFGWPYRLGVRAVYTGSISLPLQHARRLYEGAGPDACLKDSVLTLPARDKDRSGVRRFLRHERISAPTLLMHRDVALRSNSLMGFERSAHAIVRSAGDPKYADRAAPASTQRIFVPPSVERPFAAMHGVFDRNPAHKHPTAGLPDVRFDAAAGGFPFVAAPSFEGINGEVFFGERTIATGRDQRGDAVYEERVGSSGPTHRRYYPDPAAMTWVVAVRHAGTNNYLDGRPFTTPIRKAGTYPHCRPLVLRIERDPSVRHRGARPRLHQVLSQPSRRQTSPAVAHAVEVVVTLAPGDDFDVDVWCIPDEQALASWFAPVENIGTLALLSAGKDVKGDLDQLPKLLPGLLVSALKKMLPPQMARAVEGTLRTYCCWPEADSMQALQGNDGVGGLPAPGPVTRLAIANALHDTLTARPLDELAAVQTLRVTHATLRPFRLPAFEPTDSLRRLELRRPAPADAAPADVAAALTEYLLAGDIRVDLHTTASIEFRARTVFPNASAFDDPRRGRSARDRRNGAWPEHCGKSVETEHVFGFKVGDDGRVTLPETEISLLELADLPTPVSCQLAPEDDGMWRMDLGAVKPGAGKGGWGHIATRHIFPDRKARRLMVRMIARPRHEELMRTASGVARLGQRLQPGQAAVEPFDDKLPEVPIWIPAGIRPSEPITQTPVPAFVWSAPNARSASRGSVIRIPLGRGWFSSGQGERLGIVVWPPGWLNEAAGLPPQPVGPGGYSTHPDVLKLSEFMDEDLGPGGRFVTRWGSDPTRPVDPRAPANPAFPGFLDPSSFKDLGPVRPPSAAGFPAELAPNVSMPVRVDATPDQPQADTPAITLDVSLVTYEPRFDMETEQWYVDAAIEHAFEAQPFVRLGLVRFQPHAPKDLQVSFPITQWVQLLPRRDVSVTTLLRDSVEFARVTVEGLGPLNDRFDAADDIIGTRVWAHVTSEYVNEAGITCRSARPPMPMSLGALQGVGRPADGYRGPRRSWSIDINLDALLDHSGFGVREKVSHFVYVEEREAYLPATYVHEPVSPSIAAGELATCMHQESGPRFVARLALQKRKTRG